MPNAIVGYFDRETDSFIRSIWKDLADNDICDYLYSSENNPHIKFSMHTQLDVEKAVPMLADFAAGHKRLDLHLKNYGFLALEKPILFLDFSTTIPLIQLQNDIQNTFSPYGTDFDFNFFDEGIWKPDCVLTVEVDKSKLAEAVMLVMERPLQFNGTLERLGIIEFHPARQIVSFDLK